MTTNTFMDHPLEFFENSVTAMHSIGRGELAELQRDAMVLRFAQHRESIEMVGKLADRLGVTAVDTVDDIVPLMFSHTVYKSYPPALIDKKRFDLMTRWLAKLTSYDLSRVDATDARSIDEWLERVEAASELQVMTSSGTTGTLSIIPKDELTTVEGMQIWRATLFQKFGRQPTEDQLNPVVDVIWPNYSGGRVGHARVVPWLQREFTGGDESRFHALYSGVIDTDMMFLAAKMRAAAAKGELDRLRIDPDLTARRDEFIAMQQRAPQEVTEFLRRLTTQLHGKRVFMSSTYGLMYTLAAAGLAEGLHGVFAPDSAIQTGGGRKAGDDSLPPDFMDVIREFYGNDVQEGYGFSEHNGIHAACGEGRYHLQPWVIPYLLDPDSSEPLPRTGRRTGRFAVYDLVNQSHWGGVITGDEMTIDWDTPCACGRTSIALEHDIMRYSEKQGVNDDRISCAATHEVHNEAIDFLREFEA